MVLKLFYISLYVFYFFFIRFPTAALYVNVASADAVLFILCPTQSYNLTVILLQHLIKINKCMSRRERSWSFEPRTPGLLCCSSSFRCSRFFPPTRLAMLCMPCTCPNKWSVILWLHEVYIKCRY